MTHHLRADDAQLLRIQKLTEVSRALTNATSLADVFQLTATHAADLLAVPKSLLLIVGDDGLLEMRAAHGVAPSLVKTSHGRLDELLIPRLADLLHEETHSFFAVPIIVAGAITGVLVVIRTEPTMTAADDEVVLSALADQAALALERSQLDEIGVFRERLMGIVGHDLRNPLNTVVMAADLLLLCEGLGEKETGLARRIARSAATMSRLIDQLLDLTRSRLGGGIPIDPTSFDLGEVWNQVVVETGLTHPDRPMQVDTQGDLTGLWDRDRMYQLLSNLVGNAVQHGEPRSPIGLRIEAGETDVMIEVASRGEPIPIATLPFLFDAFRQGRTDHPTRSGGLGLGLYIAHEIARAHRGSIAVTSSESDGTRFRVDLPRRTGPAVPALSA